MSHSQIPAERTAPVAASCRPPPSPIRDVDSRARYDLDMTSLAASMPSSAFRWLHENRERKSRPEYIRSQSAAVDNRVGIPAVGLPTSRAVGAVLMRPNGLTISSAASTPVRHVPGHGASMSAVSPYKPPTVLSLKSSPNFRWSDTQLSPTQPSKDLMFSSPKSNRSRADKFSRIFPDITDTVVNSYHCALLDDMLFQGVLYVTKNWFCFHSKLIGKKLIKIPVSAVTTIAKMNTALIIPNAVGICTATDKYVFGSLMARRSTYQVLLKVWQEAGARTFSTNQPDDSSNDVFDITNNNNVPKTCRHSRHPSDETNNSHTTSASDDASYDPGAAASEPLDRHRGRTRFAADDDNDDSDQDVPDSTCRPADLPGDEAVGQGPTSVGVGEQLQATAVDVRKRHRIRSQLNDGTASPSRDFDGNASSVVNHSPPTNEQQGEYLLGEKYRPTNCALSLIAVTIVLLLLSAVFMALRLVHLQAQQEVYSTIHAERPGNSAPAALKNGGEEVYRLRHERHRAVIDRLHTMTEAHVQLLDKVKKSLEELSEVTDTNYRYRSLTDEFGDVDGGLTSTLTAPSDSDRRRNEV